MDPDQSGRILCKDLILGLLDDGDIRIDPFDCTRFRTSHYLLSAEAVFTIVNTGENKIKKMQDLSSNMSYTFAPDEYCLVGISPSIALPAGIVAHILPTVDAISHGFAINSGKIDGGYGHIDGKAQQVVVGVKNLLNSPNVLHNEFRLAYAYFIDLRVGEESVPAFTDAELAKFAQWSARYSRARDDGVYYDD